MVWEGFVPAIRANKTVFYNILSLVNVAINFLEFASKPPIDPSLRVHDITKPDELLMNHTR